MFTATAETAEADRTGSALGLQQTVLGVAATGSPIVFAAIVAHGSWPAGFAFAALCPLSAIALLRGPHWARLRNAPDAHPVSG